MYFSIFEFYFFVKACKDDQHNNEVILKNFAILQKNILDIDLGNKLKTEASQVI